MNWVLRDEGICDPCGDAYHHIMHTKVSHLNGNFQTSSATVI